MERLELIKKRGRFFKYMFIVLFVLTPAIPVVMWMNYNNLPEIIRLQMVKEHPVPWVFTLSLNQRMLASLAGIIVSLISMAGFYYLIKLFSMYEKGVIFSEDNVNCYRKLGYLIFCSMFADILHSSAMSVILSLHNPPGQRILTVSLSSSEIAIGVIGMIVVLISRVMDAGRELKEEQELTV